jgi:hypothetical protein
MSSYKNNIVKKRIEISLLVILIVLTSGCKRAGTPASENYVVTGNADGAPAGCSPQDIANRLVEMFNAINQSDPYVVDEYFGRKSNAPLQWYSMTIVHNNKTVINHFVAHTWNELDAYFKLRFEQHEQMRLLNVQFNGWNSAIGVVDFGPIEIDRHADDLVPGLLPANSIASGKGTYHCETRAFIVLSLVMNINEP